MNIYASTPPHNTDPRPYRGSGAGLPRYASNVDRFGIDPTLLHAPRPEFNIPRAHEANPVLLFFRKDVERYGKPAHGNYLEWLGNLNPGMRFNRQTMTPDHFDHARRVLARLVTPRHNTWSWGCKVPPEDRENGDGLDLHAVCPVCEPIA